MHTTYSEMRTMGGRTNRGVGFDKSSHLYYARTCCMGTYSNYILILDTKYIVPHHNYVLKWAYVDEYQIIDLAMTQSTEGPKNIGSISEKITVIDCD